MHVLVGKDRAAAAVAPLGAPTDKTNRVAFRRSTIRLAAAGDLLFMDIKQRLKQVIVEDLNLEELTPEQIRDDEILFGQGIGLDSLDAVELVVLVKKHFGVEIKDMTEGRKAFTSIDSLARFIAERMPA
jgi:acyl carrier protein